MLDCISVENMRKSDEYTIKNFVPSLELMHRAAYGVYKAVSWQGKTAILAGSGNNGGDGFALACILKENGFNCAVFTLSERFSNDSGYYAQKAKDMGVSITSFTENCLNGYNIVVDCLLGTGFNGSLRENYRTAIETINKSDAYVVSVDINSGMNGDSGEAELAVFSDITVTIGFVKRGLVSKNAEKYIKRLVCVDIGIILLNEEDKIYDDGDKKSIDINKKNYYQCPKWLDMNIIKVY